MGETIDVLVTGGTRGQVTATQSLRLCTQVDTTEVESEEVGFLP